MHVDDLFITSVVEDMIEALSDRLRSRCSYGEISETNFFFIFSRSQIKQRVEYPQSLSFLIAMDLLFHDFIHVGEVLLKSSVETILVTHFTT